MSLSKMLEDYRNKKREFPTYDELAAIASSDQCADPIVERNVSLLRQRSAVGVQKYGTTLADNKLPLRAWLNHALEEALDQANYLQAAMQEIDAVAPKVAMDERQAFEAAARRITHSGDSSFEREGDDYTDYTQSRHWSFWQARAALQAAPVQAQEPAAEIERLKKCLENCNAKIAQLRGDRFSGLAPAQPVAVPDGDPRPLFNRKLAYLEQRGYEVIGRILHKDGQYALFDSSCRWLEKAQYQRLMHEQNGSLFAAPAAQSDVIEGELTKIAKSGAEKNFPGFLEWIADRLVYVHEENNNVDYVQTLRLRASQIRTAIAAKP